MRRQCFGLMRPCTMRGELPQILQVVSVPAIGNDPGEVIRLLIEKNETAPKQIKAAQRQLGQPTKLINRFCLGYGYKAKPQRHPSGADFLRLT